MGLVHGRPLFWDSRVAIHEGGFISPAGDAASGVDSSPLLAVQAMFPVTSRDEMRGAFEDGEAHTNELAYLADDDFEEPMATAYEAPFSCS